MIFNLEALRVIVRPYAAKTIALSELLEKLWPMMLAADVDSQELVESIQDLLALHAAKSIDEIALRQRLIQVAFPPPGIASINITHATTIS